MQGYILIFIRSAPFFVKWQAILGMEMIMLKLKVQLYILSHVFVGSYNYYTYILKLALLISLTNMVIFLFVFYNQYDLWFNILFCYRVVNFVYELILTSFCILLFECLNPWVTISIAYWRFKMSFMYCQGL